jgi:hypothetical protein
VGWGVKQLGLAGLEGGRPRAQRCCPKRWGRALEWGGGGAGAPGLASPAAPRRLQRGPRSGWWTCRCHHVVWRWSAWRPHHAPPCLLSTPAPTPKPSPLRPPQRHHEAIDTLMEVVRLAPNLVDPYYTLASLYEVRGGRGVFGLRGGPGRERVSSLGLKGVGEEGARPGGTLLHAGVPLCERAGGGGGGGGLNQAKRNGNPRAATADGRLQRRRARLAASPLPAARPRLTFRPLRLDPPPSPPLLQIIGDKRRALDFMMIAAHIAPKVGALRGFDGWRHGSAGGWG